VELEPLNCLIPMRVELGVDSEAGRASALGQSGPIYEDQMRVQQIPSLLG
jgi:hypothetical protein